MLLIATALFLFATLVWFLERGDWLPSSSEEYEKVSMDKSLPGVYVREGMHGVSKELTPFESIPAAFWWTIVTITTVGYGDQVPRSEAGKIVAAFAMLYGAVILGLPLFVVGASFGHQYDRLMKSAAKRSQNAQASEGVDGLNGDAQRHEAIVKSLTVAYSEFKTSLKAHHLIESRIKYNWVASLDSVLLSSESPSYHLDRLSLRILGNLAEVEERWTNFSWQHSAKKLRMACRRVRTAWHRLMHISCQLSNTPHSLVLKAIRKEREDEKKSSTHRKNKTKNAQKTPSVSGSDVEVSVGDSTSNSPDQGVAAGGVLNQSGECNSCDDSDVRSDVRSVHSESGDSQEFWV